MEKKITKKEMFALIAKEVAHKEEMVAFINHEIELLEKKKGSVNSKKVAEQTKEENIVKAVLSNMGKRATVTEMLEYSIDLVTELKTNQKVSAVLKRLIEKGEVTKTVEKKVSYFAIV